MAPTPAERAARAHGDPVHVEDVELVGGHRFRAMVHATAEGWLYLTDGLGRVLEEPWEFSLVLRKVEETAPPFPFSTLEKLANYVLMSGKSFGNGHRIPLGEGFVDPASPVRSLYMCADPTAEHGDLLRLVGITDDERLYTDEVTSDTFIEQVLGRLPGLVTDPTRTSPLEDDPGDPVEIQLPPDDPPRLRHYHFGYRAIPHLLHERKDDLLKGLLSERSAAVLASIWNQLEVEGADPLPTHAVGRIPGRPGRSTLALGVKEHLRVGDTDVLLIQMPPAEHRNEAHFLALVPQEPGPLVFTWEKTLDGLAKLGLWGRVGDKILREHSEDDDFGTYERFRARVLRELEGPGPLLASWKVQRDRSKPDTARPLSGAPEVLAKRLVNLFALEQIALVALLSNTTEPSAAVPLVLVAPSWSTEEAAEQFPFFFEALYGGRSSTLQTRVEKTAADLRAHPLGPSEMDAHLGSLGALVEDRTPFAAGDVRSLLPLLVRTHHEAADRNPAELGTLLHSLDAPRRRALARAALADLALRLHTSLRQAGIRHLDPPDLASWGEATSDPDRVPLVRGLIEQAVEHASGDLRALLLLLWTRLVVFEHQWRLFLDTSQLGDAAAALVEQTATFEETWKARVDPTTLSRLRVPWHLDRVRKLVARSRARPVERDVTIIPVHRVEQPPALMVVLNVSAIPLLIQSMRQASVSGGCVIVGEDEDVHLLPALFPWAGRRARTSVIGLDPDALEHVLQLEAAPQVARFPGLTLKFLGPPVPGTQLRQLRLGQAPYVRRVMVRLIDRLIDPLPDKESIPFRHRLHVQQQIDLDLLEEVVASLQRFHPELAVIAKQLLDGTEACLIAAATEGVPDLDAWDRERERAFGDLAALLERDAERARQDEALRTALDVELLPRLTLEVTVHTELSDPSTDLPALVRHLLVDLAGRWETLAPADAAGAFRQAVDPLLQAEVLDVGAVLAHTEPILTPFDGPARREALLLRELGIQLQACSRGDRLDKDHLNALSDIWLELRDQDRRSTDPEGWWRTNETPSVDFGSLETLETAWANANGAVKSATAAVSICRVQPEKGGPHVQRIADTLAGLGDTPEERWVARTLEGLLDEAHRVVQAGDGVPDAMPDTATMVSEARIQHQRAQAAKHVPTAAEALRGLRSGGPWEPIPHTPPGAGRPQHLLFQQIICRIYLRPDQAHPFRSDLRRRGDELLKEFWQKAREVDPHSRSARHAPTYLGSDQVGLVEFDVIAMPPTKGRDEARFIALTWDGSRARFILLQHDADGYRLVDDEPAQSISTLGRLTTQASLGLFLVVLYEYLRAPGGFAAALDLVRRFPSRPPGSRDRSADPVWNEDEFPTPTDDGDENAKLLIQGLAVLFLVLFLAGFVALALLRS